MKSFTKAAAIFALFLSLINIDSAFSQLRFGVRGGVDVVSHKINDKILDSSNRLGFQIGGVVEMTSPIIGLGGELAVLYGYQEYDVKNTDIEVSNYHYMQIPLNVKQRFKIIPNLGIFVAAGPYISFRLGGNEVDDKRRSIPENYKTKNFGAGVNIGAGVSLINKIEVGMYYRKMVTDNYSEDKSGISDILKKHPDNWTINLTYIF